jgi:hypothetical protein
MLDEVKGLAAAVLQNWNNIRDRNHKFIAGDNIYCPRCGDERRMQIRCLELAWNSAAVPRSAEELAKGIAPSLFVFNCVQCETVFTAVVYSGTDGPAVAVLPSCRGGMTTPHTPPGVAFYLDQAHRAQTGGAFSAAVAMFRAALDQILFEQGYTRGMLGAKIKKLSTDIGAENAPQWARELDPEFFDVLKKLGNASIHPNDGDFTKQSLFDNGILHDVQETFLMLLFTIYEVPKRKQARLDALKAAAAAFDQQEKLGRNPN